MRFTIAFAILLFAPVSTAFGQWKPKRSAIYENIPDSRPVRDASETTKPYRLDSNARAVRRVAPPAVIVLRLPVRRRTAKPKLGAVLRNGSAVEVFLTWIGGKEYPLEHHIEVYRGAAGADARLVHDFKLYGGPNTGMYIFEPPDERDRPSVLVGVMGGSYWGTTYVISPDRTAIQKIADGADYEFADLDEDGIYEFVSWNRRPDDVHCHVGIFYQRYYPEVFLRSGWRFRKAWPPAEWSMPGDHNESPPEGQGRPMQVVAGFADLNGDGRVELICLQDRFQTQPKQALAIYELSAGAFHLLARAPLRANRIAYVLSGVEQLSEGPAITVFVTTPRHCDEGGWNPEGKGTSRLRYVYSHGQLKMVPD
jgi:hypothetical protein